MTINIGQIAMATFYMLILVVVGLYMSRRIKSTDDYWIGGRQTGPMTTAISYCAAYVSTVTIIGAPPLYYMFGAGYAALELFGSILLSGMVIFLIFALRMRAISERVNAVSLSGFLSVRYKSNIVRLISAVLIAIFMVPYAVSVMKGIADALEQIAGIPYFIGVIVLATVATAYLITSGYWGVATTDLIQGFTIALAVLFLASVTLKETGGLRPIVENMTVNHPEFLKIPGVLSWGQIFSYAWIWGIIAFGQPQLVTKFMGLKDVRTIGTVVRTSIIWLSITLICGNIIGLGALYLFQGQEFANIDMISPFLAATYGGTFVSGVFLCGVIAAGLSTLVALTLTASSAIAKDIYEDYQSAKNSVVVDSKKAIHVSRISTAVVMLVVIVLSLKPLDFVWFLSTMAAGAMGAAFTAPMVLGLYWKRGNEAGCISAMLGGAVVAVIWYMLGLTDIIHSFVPGTIVSFILYIAVSLFTQPLEENYVSLFFESGQKVLNS